MEPIRHKLCTGLVLMDCGRDQMQQKLGAKGSSRTGNPCTDLWTHTVHAYQWIHSQILTTESILTWTLLRWDRCSSTWRRSLGGTWKIVLWCSIMKVSSLVASSSSKSISSTEPRTQCENICTIWTEITTADGLETNLVTIYSSYTRYIPQILGVHTSWWAPVK